MEKGNEHARPPYQTAVFSPLSPYLKGEERVGRGGRKGKTFSRRNESESFFSSSTAVRLNLSAREWPQEKGGRKKATLMATRVFSSLFR